VWSAEAVPKTSIDLYNHQHFLINNCLNNKLSLTHEIIKIHAYNRQSHFGNRNFPNAVTMADVPLIRNIGMKRNFVVAAKCIKSVAFDFTFEFKANCNKKAT